VLKLGEQLELGRIELWAISDDTAKYKTNKVINQFYNLEIKEKDKYHDNPSGQE
jgi:hypothetical protein